jgi:hypothetical protein
VYWPDTRLIESVALMSRPGTPRDQQDHAVHWFRVASEYGFMVADASAPEYGCQCAMQSTDGSAPARRGFRSVTDDQARLEEEHGGKPGHCVTRMKGKRRW